MENRDVHISGSFNTRDLGGYPCESGGTIWGKVFRSGNMAHITEAGLRDLKRLNITRVIDLRSLAERAKAPDPFPPNAVPELQTISLFDDLDPRALPDKDVLQNKYIQALKISGSSFVAVLRAITSSPNAVLFHCTAGKDRTGIVAALLLAVAGVAIEDILADYQLTADRIQPLLDELHTSADKLEIDQKNITALMSCAPETMRRTLEWLDHTWGNVENYLKAHGMQSKDVHELRAALT